MVVSEEAAGAGGSPYFRITRDRSAETLVSTQVQATSQKGVVFGVQGPNNAINRNNSSQAGAAENGLHATGLPKQRGTIRERAKIVHRGGEKRAFRRSPAISGGGEAELFLKTNGKKGVVFGVQRPNNENNSRQLSYQNQFSKTYSRAILESFQSGSGWKWIMPGGVMRCGVCSDF
jgi:hypothetical protein